MHRLAPLAVLSFAAVVGGVAGCGDAADVKSLEGEVTDLRGQLKRAEGENDKLARRLDDTDRKLSGLREDLITSRESTMRASGDPAAAPAAGAAPGDAGPDATATSPENPALDAEAKALADVLATDDGIQVLEGALKTIEKRRDEERTARMVQGMVDAFAQKAALSPQQAESLQKIASRSAAATRELWSAFRDAGDLTAEQRQSLRTDLLAKGEEIRVRTDDEVKGILDAQQFEIYKQDSERLRGAFRGFGGGPGGGGMGGGRGGLGGDGGR